MNKTIKYNGTYIGLPEDIYTKKYVDKLNNKNSKNAQKL